MILAPSLLSADPGCYSAEIGDVEKAGAGLLHIDVMDGHFVPNLSFGPDMVRGLRPLSRLPFDVHLMVDDPARFLSAYIAAGADIITIHAESRGDAAGIRDECTAKGVQFGLAVCPETPLSSVKKLLPQLDLLLIMGVHPGFGGQKLLAGTPDRVREAAALRESLGAKFFISVDGGVDAQKAASVVSAGADILVAGSAVFGQNDRGAAIRAINQSGRQL